MEDDRSIPIVKQKDTSRIAEGPVLSDLGIIDLLAVIETIQRKIEAGSLDAQPCSMEDQIAIGGIDFNAFTIGQIAFIPKRVVTVFSQSNWYIVLRKGAIRLSTCRGDLTLIGVANQVLCLDITDIGGGSPFDMPAR